MLALSTAWNAFRLEDGTEIAKEIHALGFNAIELNFSLDNRLIENIRRYCLEKNIAITSLHNFCPVPDGFAPGEALPDCFSLSSLDENERKKAVFFTARSIKTANTLGAKALVLHSGRVEIQDNTRLLIELYTNGKAKSKEFSDILKSSIQERQKHAKGHLEQIIKSYGELIPLAEENNIVLGIENRFYYREIPSLEEFALIFERFKTKTMGYWHDVGHAYILEKLGFIPEGAMIERYADRLCGIHIHNIKNLTDHQAPTKGEFDLKTLRPYIRQDVIKVIEMNSKVNPEDIKESLAYIKEIFGD